MEKEQSGFLKFIKFIFDENNHGTEEKRTDLMREPNIFTDSYTDYQYKKILRGDEE